MSSTSLSREKLIRQALEQTPHHTEFFARYARCSVGEAVVVLQRLRREGIAETNRSYTGMTWRAA